MPNITKLPRALVALAVVLGLGAWPIPIANASANVAGQQPCLVAGAEALETLTEHAARAPAERLVVEARAAATTSRGCEGALALTQGLELTQVIARLNRFEADRNRAALALNAVEGYRILVTAQARGPQDAPLEVALLDYAGFRYQAGAQASPVLRDEMTEAVAVADKQWRSLSSHISDSKLRTSFAASIEAMRAAAKAGNAKQARHAVSVELKRVDALEQFFAKRPL
ncbi:MAG: hypothetical protein HOP13_03400 [Alphaproteobacteria bacterium]|nr:hypothetical protein [Alphaproteobacteria bacterium]